MRKRSTVLTEQELEIMKVVWDSGEATVRDVYEALLSKRKIAYTTVMTMMRVLEDKGHLKKKTGEKAFVYRPSEAKQRVLGGMVAEFLQRVFDGSAKPLLLHLVESESLSREELAEIGAMARTKKAKR